MDVGKAEAVSTDFHIRAGDHLMQLAAVIIDQIPFLDDIGQLVDMIYAKSPIAQQQLTHGIMPMHGTVKPFPAVILPVGIDQHGKLTGFKYGMGKCGNVHHGNRLLSAVSTTR